MTEPILTWVTEGATVTGHVRREGCDCDYEGFIIIDKPAPASEIEEAVSAGAAMTMKGVVDMQRDHADHDSIRSVIGDLLEFVEWAEANAEKIKEAWRVSLTEANAHASRAIA